MLLDKYCHCPDFSKVNKAGLFQLCPLSSIDRLVIDQAPSESLALALRNADVEVIVSDEREADVRVAKRRRGRRVA